MYRLILRLSKIITVERNSETSTKKGNGIEVSFER